MIELTVKTSKREELIDITQQVQAEVEKSGVQDGICWLFVPHTTAGITINENADPSVRLDILEQMRRLLPRNLPYLHKEGNADAHVKSVLVGNSLWVAVLDRRLKLGTWQGIFFCEFDGPRNRKVWLNFTLTHNT